MADVDLITASNDSADSPWLDYERIVAEDGTTQAAYYHPEHDEPLVGSDLSAGAEAPDDWSMRWYCPRCGTTEPSNEELAPAGMVSIHVPCATEGEMETAGAQEQSVATNLQNAQAFNDGAFDGGKPR